MENNETFKMTYSARQQEEINQIRQKYEPKELDKMEQLRALDASVGKKATTVALILGILGALIMGLGMSLAMTDIGQAIGQMAMPVGIIIGIIGIVLVSLAYPVYNRVLAKERKKIAPQILRLTEELTK